MPILSPSIRGLTATLIIYGSLPALTQEVARPTFEARIKALGLERRLLADEDNPILAIQKPLKELEKRTGKQLDVSVLKLRRLPLFTDYKISAETGLLCREAQTDVLKTMARGPGQVPDDLDFAKFNIFAFLAFQKANRALANRALAAKKIEETISHLVHNLTAADFILSSEPNLVSYLVAVNVFRRGAFDDLIELYRHRPDPKLLTRITALHRRHSFKEKELASALRGETHITLQAFAREPGQFMRNLNAKAPGYWKLFSEEPLASCTLEQLLALPFQFEPSRHLVLDDLEINLRWIKSGAPLSAHPRLKTPRPKPKALPYYQKAPNGLFEIFEDCGEEQSNRSVLIVNRGVDALVKASLACLRAEADGHKVASLSLLVPNYLDKVPRDPGDGKPLRFLPQRRTLYVVGADLRDDGGVSGFDAPGADEDATFDLTLQLPTITARK